MTAAERMAADRVPRATTAEWFEHFTWKTPGLGSVVRRMTTATPVYMTPAMMRERDWCPAIKVHALSADPGSIWYWTQESGAELLHVDITNAALARHFGETSGFRDDRLEDLRGVWKNDLPIRDRDYPERVLRWNREADDRYGTLRSQIEGDFQWLLDAREDGRTIRVPYTMTALDINDTVWEPVPVTWERRDPIGFGSTYTDTTERP